MRKAQFHQRTGSKVNNSTGARRQWTSIGYICLVSSSKMPPFVRNASRKRKNSPSMVGSD